MLCSELLPILKSLTGRTTGSTSPCCACSEHAARSNNMLLINAAVANLIVFSIDKKA